jgi:hypothetical protein
MKGIIQAMLEEIYIKAHEVATQTNQTVGEKRNFYITLYQLEQILKSYED